MAWKNLRGEIGEMFAEYARGEELQEFTQGLWAKRLAYARSSWREYYLKLRQDPERWAKRTANNARICRASYQRLKQDPAWFATHKAKRRAYREQHWEEEKAQKRNRRKIQKERQIAQRPPRHCVHDGCCNYFIQEHLNHTKYCSQYCARQQEQIFQNQKRREYRQQKRRGAL